MRFTPRHVAVAALLAATAACGDATAPAVRPPLTTASDFSARVSQVTYEDATGPEGPYTQYDVWVAVGASGAANAGVVVPTTGPVYVRRGGSTVTGARPGDLRAGDVVEVWHDRTVAYGAVQGPPGAPTYTATQIVIDR